MHAAIPTDSRSTATGLTPLPTVFSFYTSAQLAAYSGRKPTVQTNVSSQRPAPTDVALVDSSAIVAGSAFSAARELRKRRQATAGLVVANN